MSDRLFVSCTHQKSEKTKKSFSPYSLKHIVVYPQVYPACANLKDLACFFFYKWCVILNLEQEAAIVLLLSCVFQVETKKRARASPLPNVGFVVLGAVCCSRPPPPRLLGAHFINFFFGPHLCPAECWSQPSRQQTRKSALLPACLAASSPPLRPADCGGTGQPLQANSLCPPPRAENELECCLPQTHRAAARKKDHTTRRLQPETVRNFLS